MIVPFPRPKLIYRWRLLRAECLIGLKQFNLASPIPSQILASDPRNPEALTLRARLLYLLGSHTAEQILPLLNNALAYDPECRSARVMSKKIKNLESLKTQGNDAFKTGKLSEAADIYSKCVEADTDSGLFSVKSYSNRANCSCKLGKYQESISDCEKALELLQTIEFGQEAETEDMANSIHQTLFHKLYMRKAECTLKLEDYEEAVRLYSMAGNIKTDRETQRALQDAQKQLKMSKRKDYYKILGVNRDAGETEIKKGYRKMALQYHPDKQNGLSDKEKEQAEAKFKEIGEAYAILTDPQKKHMFDNGMDLDGSDSGMGGFGGGGGVPMDELLRMFAMNGGGRARGGFGGHPGFGGHAGFGGGHPGFSHGFDDEEDDPYSHFGGGFRFG